MAQATLRVFGWSFKFDPQSSGVTAFPNSVGASRWSVEVQPQPTGDRALKLDFRVKVSGLWFDVLGLVFLEPKVGGVWVPKVFPGRTLNHFQVWRIDENPAGLQAFRVLVGPVRISWTILPTYDWDPHTGALRLALTGGITTPAPPTEAPAVAQGLEILFTQNPSVFNLAQGLLTLTAGAVEATIHAWQGGSDAAAYSAKHSNAADKAITFAAMAKPTSTLEMTLRPTGPAEVWLHSAVEYGPGLIARGAALRVRVIDAGLGKHQIDTLELTPLNFVTDVEFSGILNSLGETEHWTAADPIPLGVVARAPGKIFNGVVIAPGTSVPMVRKAGPANLPVHGGIGGHRFELSSGVAPAILRCDTPAAEPGSLLPPTPEWLSPKLHWRRTRPWLNFASSVYRHPRYGESYTGSNDEERLLTFRSADGDGGGLPAAPPEYWNSGDGTAIVAFHVRLDQALAKFTIVRPVATHESGLVDPTVATPGQSITSLFATPKGGFPLRMAEHTEVRALQNKILQAPVGAPLTAAGTFSSSAVLKPNIDLEYQVLWPGAPWRKGAEPAAAIEQSLPAQLFGQFIDPGVPIAIGTMRNGGPGQTNKRPLPWAVVKIGRKRDLTWIFADMRSRLQSGYETIWDAAIKRGEIALLDLIRETDPGVMRPEWIGVIGLQLELQLDGLPQLKSMVPTAADTGPLIDFVSVAPQDKAKPLWGGVSGAVDWRRTDSTAYAANQYADRDEARFWTEKLTVRWRDGGLTLFRSEAILEVRTFLGTGLTRDSAEKATPKRVNIIGSAKRRPGSPDTRPEYDFDFSADTRQADPRGLRIYPISKPATEADDHIVKEVWLKRVQVVASQRSAPPHSATVKPGQSADAPVDVQVAIDGDVSFKPPKWATGATDFLSSKKPISFFDLGIKLPSLSDLHIPGLQISYPDLRFDLNLPHVGLLGDALKLKFQDFTLDWDNKFDISDLPDLGLSEILGGSALSWNPKIPSIYIGGRLGFGRLPELFSRGFSDFSLDLTFGLQLDLPHASLMPGLKVAVKGFGFEGLNFDLLPFLTLRIQSLRLTREQKPAGEKLLADGITLSVCHWQLPYSMSGGFFSSQAGPDAFFVSATRIDQTPNLLDFNYGFIGQNLDFSGAQAIVQKFLEAALLDNAGDSPDPPLQSDAFAEAWGNGLIKPAQPNGEGAGWTFAAELAALYGVFRGRVLLQDRGFTGLALYLSDEIESIAEWFGGDFGFVGLYHRGPVASEDYFTMSMTLPQLDLPAFRMTGGIIAVSLWVNGGFQLDFGFPWPDGATRQWDRTIGMIISPGQASAGIYFKKTEHDVAGGQEITLGAGFALQWGLGGDWSSGPFKAWGRVGVYGVLVGEGTFLKSGTNFTLKRLQAIGAVGVLVEGAGSINWWVIHVTVGVMATAEVRVEMLYAPPDPTALDVHAELYVSAYARACIGGGWFEVCKEIHVGLSIAVHHHLTV